MGSMVHPKNCAHSRVFLCFSQWKGNVILTKFSSLASYLSKWQLPMKPMTNNRQNDPLTNNRQNDTPVLVTLSVFREAILKDIGQMNPEECDYITTTKQGATTPHAYSNSLNSRLAPNQWETSLPSNDVSHWLGANLESALYQTWRVWSPWPSPVLACSRVPVPGPSVGRTRCPRTHDRRRRSGPCRWSAPSWKRTASRDLSGRMSWWLK